MSQADTFIHQMVERMHKRIDGIELNRGIAETRFSLHHLSRFLLLEPSLQPSVIPRVIQPYRIKMHFHRYILKQHRLYMMPLPMTDLALRPQPRHHIFPATIDPDVNIPALPSQRIWIQQSSPNTFQHTTPKPDTQKLRSQFPRSILMQLVYLLSDLYLSNPLQ